MATRPAQLPRWDTNGVNRTEPSTSLKDDGYALNAVPTSANLNWQMWALWLWIDFLNSATVDFGASTVIVASDYKHGDIIEPLGPKRMESGSATAPTTHNSSQITVAAAGSIHIPIPLRVGDTWKTNRVRVQSGGGAAILSITAHKRQISTRTLTDIGTGTPPAAGVDNWVTVDVSPDEVAAQDYHYYISIVADADAATCYGAEFTKSRA